MLITIQVCVWVWVLINTQTYPTAAGKPPISTAKFLKVMETAPKGIKITTVSDGKGK